MIRFTKKTLMTSSTISTSQITVQPGQARPKKEQRNPRKKRRTRRKKRLRVRTKGAREVVLLPIRSRIRKKTNLARVCPPEWLPNKPEVMQKLKKA